MFNILKSVDENNIYDVNDAQKYLRENHRRREKLLTNYLASRENFIQ